MRCVRFEPGNVGVVTTQGKTKLVVRPFQELSFTAHRPRIGHVKIALFYTLMQLTISLSFVYLCPKGQTAHWVFLMAALALLSAAYVLFMRKYYHLHEEYLASLRK